MRFDALKSFLHGLKQKYRHRFGLGLSHIIYIFWAIHISRKGLNAKCWGYSKLLLKPLLFQQLCVNLQIMHTIR
jgi:hypothetical protein